MDVTNNNAMEWNAMIESNYNFCFILNYQYVEEMIRHNLFTYNYLKKKFKKNKRGKNEKQHFSFCVHIINFILWGL